MSEEIDDPIVLPEKVNMGSKYFETEVQFLREAVSEYLRIGVCISKRGAKAERVMRSPGMIQQLCKEIAKERGTPYVEVYWHGVENAILTVPKATKTAPLLSMPMLIGHTIVSERQYMHHAVAVLGGSTRTKVYFNGPKGMEALRAWVLSIQTDNKLRTTLGLPPKVSLTLNAVRV